MKRIHVIGGGTFSYVRNHMALSAPAFGETAIRLAELFEASVKEATGLPEPAATWAYRSAKMGVPGYDVPATVTLHLTKMADPRGSRIVTNDDVAALVDTLVADPETRVIIFNPAMCDYTADVVELFGDSVVSCGVPSGKHAQRLKTRARREDGSIKKPLLELTPSQKVVNRIRKVRKDIFVVGFKTTTNATEQEQYVAGLNLLKENGINLVLANDTANRRNMIIVPEEERYCVTTDRDEVLRELVKMVNSRSAGRFTRSTVVGSEADLVPWQDERVPENFRTVVEYLIAHGAYKPFRGSTAGHFAVKVGEGRFLTSRRKTDFNIDLRARGLVLVEAQGDDRVVAHGAVASVGGQSQRIVFQEHPEMDCIVHFHCPRVLRQLGDDISVREQWRYECGSHECGANTSAGLREHVVGRGRVKAVMLEKHGPNIVFSRDTPAEEVIRFIERNFDLTDKTGGLLT
jgi:hypothetical protein